MHSDEVLDPPFPRSLCHACAARRYVTGRASVFVLCTALAQKYPPQPVLACAGFQPPRGRENPTSERP